MMDMQVVIVQIHQFLQMAIQGYSLLLMVYALMSWFPDAYHTKIGTWIIRLCEPYLDYFRRIIPSFGMISFSVMLGLAFLQLVSRGLTVIFSLLLN